MGFTVFENGVFHTLVAGASAPHGPTSLVVSGESIAFMGSSAECRDLTGGRHETIDLGGAHVVPGFADSHLHTAQLALQSTELNLSSAISLEQALALVTEHIARRNTPSSSALNDSAGDWVFGGRWNNRVWADTEVPTRWQLDTVTGGIPVALHHGDLHTYWVNSAALSRMGITRDTPDPVGGSIVRDADGEPTGILGEAAAFAAERFFAPLTSTDLDATIEHTLQGLLAHGITTIHDIDGTDAHRAFRTLHTAGRLPLRVQKLMPVAELDALLDAGIRSGDGDSMLRYGAVKIFGDGSLSSHTCLLHEAYPAQPDNTGIAVTPPELLDSLVERCNAAGLAAAVHAIGDGAVSNALSALERVSGPGASRSILPNRIEHVQHIAPSDVARLGALPVVACMQPASCTSDIDMVDQILWGRDLGSYAWRSILDAGGTLAFSSDAPVESTNPFTGIFAAVTRQRPGGYPTGGWQPEQRASRAEAFAAYTSGPAVASAESRIKGRLAPGFLADFAVLDRDPFSVDDTALLDTTIALTVVGGIVRWAR
ncbi:amidohydrolase [Glaciibacter psychrotolerans]|uniref:Amidohydrolase 3 domain-containing protein n=1 Tax=Glaciibacter psychrotolerans TaxID=670054 RepID=A0A7Z0EEZ3_9MICO|nr:amidohydrolase [Leifsonia psychrotolerans]NYJ20439.1 hypothetical protein [Leifsonia psychrotolerans]